MLQNTYTRAALLANDVYVISEASHIEPVYQQLPKIPRDHIIVEPGRRGTASCVIMALARIKSKHAADESIVFMHADHHIRDTQSFVDTVQRASSLAEEFHRIVLLGLEPTHPATGFGYIERGNRTSGNSAAYEVKSFKEKPTHVIAEKYLAAGRYLWNMGYFVATLGTFETAIHAHAPKLWSNFQALLSSSVENQDRTYLDFVNEPIDTALIEKVPELLVIPGTFDWMDVGSFPDMHQVNAQDEMGNTVQGKAVVDSVTNSLVRNDTDVPLAVIGLDNVAVISTPQGIVVTNKSFAQKVGDVSKRIIS
ncbi:MAG: mannose-1-phosphate guanylyltransferase [Candidatus Saccharimonadales bacterium]